MNDDVIDDLQSIIVSGKCSTTNEIVNKLLENHNLSLKDVVEIKRIAQIQLDNNCILKLFLKED